MKKYDLYEEFDASIKQKILSSPIITNPWKMDDQLSFVLSDDELDWEWYKTILPLYILEKYVDLDTFENPGCSIDDEKQRYDGIMSWFKHNGGIETALDKQPPAFILDHNDFYCLDGRHRLYLAKQLGLKNIPIIVHII